MSTTVDSTSQAPAADAAADGWTTVVYKKNTSRKLAPANRPSRGRGRGRGRGGLEFRDGRDGESARTANPAARRGNRAAARGGFNNSSNRSRRPRAEKQQQGGTSEDFDAAVMEDIVASTTTSETVPAATETKSRKPRQRRIGKEEVPEAQAEIQASPPRYMTRRRSAAAAAEIQGPLPAWYKPPSWDAIPTPAAGQARRQRQQRQRRSDRGRGKGKEIGHGAGEGNKSVTEEW